MIATKNVILRAGMSEAICAQLKNVPHESFSKPKN